jgi:2-polyprenyl-3-methyl-5-hydroxy-6-metoxy-1,4-benzoquinol methylase
VSRPDLTDDGARYMDDPRTEVVALVPPGLRVLDVGCSRGAFGAELKRRDPRREVYGIEPTAAAKHAEGRLTAVAQGFFPNDLPKEWSPFDVICFNDVLEHVVDPWAVLDDTHDVLTSRGAVVASLPNVRYIEVVTDLVLRGQWHYEPTGVLDRTHLRFFTEASMIELFEECRFQVESVTPTHLAEARGRSARLIRKFCLTGVMTPFLAQRYVLVARPMPVAVA